MRIFSQIPGRAALLLTLAAVMISGGTFAYALADAQSVMDPQELVSQKPGPEALVQQTAERVFEKIREEMLLLEKDPDRITGLVEDIVVPNFDFIQMSKWVLGKNWNSATREQRIKFVAEFRSLLVRTYASSLIKYADAELVFLPMTGSEEERDVMVRSEIEQAGGFPVTVNYRLSLRKSGWKIYDVTIDGVSLIANYRASFAKEIKEGGMDALNERLSQRRQGDKT